MFQKSRHFQPAPSDWNTTEASDAITEIAEDALSSLDPDALWPAHPMDDGVQDGAGCLYFGAAGVIWALDYLRRVEAISDEHDFTAVLSIALDRNAPWFAATPYARHASLLMGDLGILLVAMRIAPDPGRADEIYTLAAMNCDLPVVELMWGLPGSMLACLQMNAMTNDARFKALFCTQAERLLGELEMTDDGPIWTQDLYGRRQRYLGPLHGFAGNMLPLIHGWEWLTPDQRAVISEGVPRTLATNAVRSELGTNWPAVTPSDRPPVLCQHCHGAPGIVTTFADAAFSTPEFEALLCQGGDLTWNAGALSKGSNLCHGTGGNGYALLKLYKRTGDPIWLERARTFAMTAISQVRGARAAFGRGRYSLWTGDVGLAVYLWDCITAQPRFPTIDVL
jgi:lantibiotic modifying enzyme